MIKLTVFRIYYYTAKTRDLSSRFSKTELKEQDNWKYFSLNIIDKCPVRICQPY